jgi:catechol 2,3-dioxygenase-like lactoylglutathione lyase family enzyme
MESMIARLVGEFESGKLSRRQLVRMLAMLAAGAPVATAMARSAAAAAAPVPSAAPWKTVWLDHISYQVSDYKRSVDFYVSLMGWRVVEDTGSQATLDLNGVGNIIIRNRPAGAPAGIGVVDHISWGIQPWDTDAVKAELEKRHLAPEADMVGNDFKSFLLKDPDGWQLQISNQTKEKHG